MSGRFEHQVHIDRVVKDNLKDFPPILNEYYKRSSGMQSSSRHVVMNNVKRFFLFNEEKGTDIFNNDWLKEITADDIVEYFFDIKVRTLKNGKQKVLSDSTIATMLHHLDNFFTFLVKQKYIDDNPITEAMEYFPKYKVKKRVVYMTPEEVNHVKETIASESPYPCRDLCIFMLGCRTGLRQSAITEIDISDIDFENMSIQVVEKGNVYKDVLIDPDTLRLIRECINERGNIPGEDALFIRFSNGKRITAWDMRVLLDTYAIDLNKRITPHKMRSTCGTNLYEKTGDIFLVADRLGHTNIQNTKRYVDTLKKGKEAARIMGELF